MKKSNQAAFPNVKFTMISTAAVSCDTTADALIVAVNAGGTSVLAACEATNPAAAVDSLSAAIVTAVKAQLDAAAGAGTITASEESDFLTNPRSSLNKWLTTSVQASTGGPKA
ncbi:MAG: hypothetical protein ACRDG4_21325 [Chloroflexota bacterium]